MGGNTEERLRWKEPLHSFEVELQGEFGLSPVASRALIRRQIAPQQLPPRGWIAGPAWGSGS